MFNVISQFLIVSTSSTLIINALSMPTLSKVSLHPNANQSGASASSSSSGASTTGADDKHPAGATVPSDPLTVSSAYAIVVLSAIKAQLRDTGGAASIENSTSLYADNDAPLLASKNTQKRDTGPSGAIENCTGLFDTSLLMPRPCSRLEHEPDQPTHVAFDNLYNHLSTAPMVHHLMILAAALLLVFAHRRKSKVQTPWPKVPGGRFFYGNLPEDLNFLFETIEDWASKYGKDGIFEATMVGKQFFFLCNEEKASIVERMRPFQVVKRKKVTRAIDSLGGKGLFSAEGEDWKKERRLVAPALNHKNMRDYLASVKLVTSRLIEKWRSHYDAGTHVIAVNEDIMSSALDVISLVGFAHDLNSLHTANESADLVNAFMSKIFGRVFAPVPFWNIPIIGQYLDGAGWIYNKLRNHFLQVIGEFEARAASSAIASSDTASSDKDRLSKSFLGKVLTFNKKDKDPLSTDRMIGNILTLFAAGSETTGISSISATYLLAADTTGLQDELAKEAMDIGRIEDATLEMLTQGMPRMRSFIYEAIRTYGAINSSSLTNVVPVNIEGTVIPPGSNFIVCYRYINTLDPADGGHPFAVRGPRDVSLKEFCSRRYLSGPADSPSCFKPSFKNGFRPFGEGVRVCPGRELAEVEMVFFFTSILREFEISLEPGHSPLRLVTKFTQSPDSDIRIVLKPRRGL